LKLLDDTEPSSVIPIADSTVGALSGIDSRYMNKAALYARVSTDAQQKEGTINSQVIELKRQIEAAGHVLVKEYLDDGYSGTLLDRPALDQMRADAKTDVFDAIYFLDTDRIARDVAYQTIIIAELIKHDKQIIIKGKDYVNNPENKFTVTVLGAVAELERAKIIERTTRGRLHRLRLGELASGGNGIFGYDYIAKTADASAALVVNQEQAVVVRSMFEMFASGNFGLVTISRSLEERGIPTQKGRRLWDSDRVKTILKNETYSGTRYYNRMTFATEANRKGKQLIKGKYVYRDRAEWIAVKVPAIVPQELFDKVQEKLREHKERYSTPVTHYLLSRLVQCGCCGGRYSSARGRQKILRRSGKVAVYHQALYRCIRQSAENNHDRKQIKRCPNSQISTHILESKVLEMIRETMFDPEKLRACIRDGVPQDDRSVARHLTRVARDIRVLDDERRRLMNRYALEEVTGDDYITANRALDKDLERLTREKAELAAASRSSRHEDFVDASIRQFCANANARFQACADFDAKRQFLRDHIERVIFNRYKVTITGSVPIQSASGETKLQFRIASEINKSAVRIKAADRSGWNDPNRTSPEGWGLGKTLMGHHETTV
jgi:site-specific DNA recombinase